MKTLHIFQFYIFSLSINLFTLFAYLVYQSDLILSNFRSKLQNEYDFIIVGSGTAGSLIAHRLATETNFTFIVLEAGSRSHALLEIPVLGPLLHGSMFDWQFTTVPQEHACLAMIDNKCKLTQGKILGGSSKLNNMVHFRGNLSHYVNWFHHKYSEDYIRHQFELLENNIFHINDILYESEMSDAVLNAAIELGYNEINNNFQEGFMKPKLTIKNGKRWTTSDNLDVSKVVATNALVEKLLFVKKKCIGVKLHDSHEIFARKGVVLSAGAINSPKILQLSGIGPSKLLKPLDIPIIKDLPVGQNLQDHVGSGLDLVLFNRSLSVNPFNIMNPFNVVQYFVYGKGSLTPAGCEVIGFLSSKNNTIPDVQLMVLPVGLSTDRGSKLMKTLGLKNVVWENYFAKLFDKHAATIFALTLHPKSKGEVYIRNKDPLQNPVIDPKYLTNTDDVKILVDGLKIVKKFINTNAFKRLDGHINEFPFPGCENYTIFSNDYWECYIKHLTLTSYHPVGTCSMGLPHEKTSVVDTSFKVIGIEGLYVADSSVLPTLPSGNINAAVAMMASIFFESNIKSLLKKYKKSREGFSQKENLFLKTCVT